ncbi:hypothetical protein TWF730_006737 [Orbilia blumenaviensis]|uniref:Helicase ATP-binding domain-containing protein n=1 Tax=Orbilia blumenaviensis TaxID=1796055 RepID=A0AAV9VHQ0_9PEZI
MPRKGTSSKRRLSSGTDEPVATSPDPEHVAQNERLRRTRSRITLGPVEPQATSQPRAGAKVGQTEEFVPRTFVDVTTATSVAGQTEGSSQVFSSTGLLQSLPNASNVGIQTSGRLTRSKSSAVRATGENVPPPKPRRRQPATHQGATGSDFPEFGTPDIIDDNDDDESEFDGSLADDLDSDEGGEQLSSRSRSGGKTAEARAGPARPGIRAGRVGVPLKRPTKAGPGANPLKSSPAVKWSENCLSDLPPLSNIDDIFEDLTRNHGGLVDVAQHLNGRPLRVATMCSGTESPLLALGLMAKHLNRIAGAHLSFEHLFSCEIEPFKQAYIERNFRPKLLFRDVCELSEEYATTAYGSKVKVPGDCDMLVAGTSCVDYSNLNNHGKGLEDGGESGRTFYGMLEWVKKHKPKVVILENVCQAPWANVVRKFEEVGYVAGHSRFDTKNFYIPHTRQRGYLVAFLDDGKNRGDLPEKWVGMVNAKTRPASVSFEEFCLEDDHPKVVEVRVKLQDENPKNKAVEWIACEHRHNVVRTNERLGRQRPFTSWQENGRSTCPDNAWRDWVDRQVDRVKDLMDINYLRGASKGTDLIFVARVHNLSQNADRNTEGKGNGLTQCLTPTMIPYSTYRGGPLIGIELLSLQGLPTDELLFTRETEANLKDLAGNAMSSTVVGTAMAAALVVGMNLLDRGEGTHSTLAGSAGSNTPLITLPGSQQLKVVDAAVCNQFVLRHIQAAATKSARKCVCEARTLTAKTIQICKACGHTSCQQCGIKPSHVYETLALSRREPLEFEKVLKEILPMIVRFKGVKDAVASAIRYGEGLPIRNKEWGLFEKNLLGALSSTFTFSGMKRKDVWVAKYDSTLGRLELLLGPEQLEWRLFVKVENASKDFKELRRLFTPPAARMFVEESGDSFFGGAWRIGVPGTADIDVKIEGTGVPIDSWEKSLGLEDAAFIRKEVFPQLRISLVDPGQEGLLDERINGEWKLLPNCGTACRALHTKEDADGKRLFLFIDPPRIGDPSNDGFVVARDCKRLEFGEYRPVIAKVDNVFRPSTEKPVVTTQINVSQFWTSVETLRLRPSGDVQTEYSFSLPEDIASHSSCSSPIAFLASSTRLTPALSAGFPRESVVIDEYNAKKAFASIGWIVEGLKPTAGTENWKIFDIRQLDLDCGTCAPRKPSLSWKMVRDKMTLIEDPNESAVWERAMKARPQAWVTVLKVENIDGHDHLQLNIGLNIASLCHRAVDILPGETGLGDLTVTWRLKSDYVRPPRLFLPSFTVKSNRADQQSVQPPMFLINLRPEQLRSLTWMLLQESPMTPLFIEQEIIEAIHPKLPWKADVKASRPNSSRGGILADAVGYGKTAIILGLLAFMKDSYLPPKDCAGRISVKGTLIIVPGHLVDQWASEIIKFTGRTFKVIIVKSMTTLRTLTIKAIKAADIILIPMGLVKSPLYLERLAEFSGSGEAPAKEGRRFKDWVKDCREKLGPQIEKLQSGNAKEVQAEIKEGFNRRKEARDSEEILGRKAHNKAASKAKSATKSPQTSDTEFGSDFEDKPVQRRGKSVTKGPPTYDDQNWQLGNLKGSWENLRTPLFELFHFNRLVVDEFTYCTGIPLEIVPGLNATFRWVLSGTPALGDFDDVKKIAMFLGIRLGIDDDIVNSDVNNKRIAKDRSAVETFQAFKETHSPAWHEDRHTHAQGFLDLFMRQNVAEGDEIPFEEHWITLKQPAAEKAIYTELDHHVKAMEMNVTRRGNSRGQGDRDSRLRSALGDSTSAEEALLKSLCHFSLNIGNLDPEASAYTACDQIVTQRWEQLESNKEELLKVLRTTLLKAHTSSNALIPKAEDPFLKFIEQKRKTDLEDADATSAFRELLQQAKNWAIDNRNRKKVQGAPQSATKDVEMRDADEPDDEEDTDIQPTNADGNAVELYRDKKVQVNRLLKELVGRFRSLRFFKVVRQAQAQDTFNRWVCACGRRDLPLQTISVSSICGHSACSECMERAVDIRRCPEKENGCESQVQPASIIPVMSLGADNDIPTTHGAKLDALLFLLQNTIPGDERVLLFIQFPDLLKKVFSVLQEAGVSVTQLSGSARDKSSELTLFQTQSTTRVLILEAMAETAAGANLTMANHVIFLSPLLTTTEHQYLAAETQAIGRIRRYGQKRKVHIWRLAVSQTIDVDIYKERKNPVPGSD